MVRIDEPTTGVFRQQTQLVDTATFNAAKWATIQATVAQMGTDVVAEATPKIPSTL
jgi:hypothetical protein